jgi:hypothetical protein
MRKDLKKGGVNGDVDSKSQSHSQSSSMSETRMDEKIDFDLLIKELNMALIKTKGVGKVKEEPVKLQQTSDKDEEYISRIDRNDRLNPNIEKIVDNNNDNRTDIYYVDNMLPTDKKQREICLKIINDFNNLLIAKFNSYKNTLQKTILEIDVQKVIYKKNKEDNEEKRNEIIGDIKKIYNKYFEQLQSHKPIIISECIIELKKQYPIFELLLKSYKYVKNDEDIEVNKEGGGKRKYRGGSSDSIKYKNIQKPQYTIGTACQKYNSLGEKKRTFYDYINENMEERMRKDATLETDMFSQIIDGNLVDSRKVQYKKTEIDLLKGEVSENIYNRSFISQKYNRELIYYIESILIDNNELIEIFTNSHIEYLKSLNMYERYIINNYTTDLYEYYNLWKINSTDIKITDLKYKLENNIYPDELKNYLNPQIWKVLIYRKIIDPKTIVDFEKTDLLKNNLQHVLLHFDEIFTLFELELNKIIIDAPPRLFSFACFRGSKQNYIPELQEGAEVTDQTISKTYFKSTQFSSYTIDIFKNAASKFAGNLDTSRIYETLVSPTAKVLYIAPLSKYNSELEIVQSTDQIIDPLYDKQQFDIYNFNYKNNFDDANLLCNDTTLKDVKHIKEIFLI